MRAISDWSDLMDEVLAGKGAAVSRPEAGTVGYGRAIRTVMMGHAVQWLDSAVTELGRVTGLSGDDLFRAAAVAIRQIAAGVVRAADPYKKARAKAEKDLEQLIGAAGPMVLDHVASDAAEGPGEV